MTSALRRPSAVGVLAALVILLIWWQLLWQPQGAAIAAAHKQTQAESTNLFTVEQNLGHLKHLATISPQLTALEQRLEAAVPTTDEVDQFMLNLNALSQQTGVTVASVSLSVPTATPAGVGIITVHLSVDGDYFAVQQFLDALRASSRIVIIDNIAEAANKAPGKSASTGVAATIGAHLLTGLTAPPAAVQQILAPTPTPTTAAPTGIISGPVTKARNAVNAANANTTQISVQASAIGGS